ncbi:hypothetical protein [Flavobacterium sp.]|uniref:hypothetical protein n=1 Tax=Flavobacterium sp. TaxID=239 RepID=UPI0037BE8AFA
MALFGFAAEYWAPLLFCPSLNAKKTKKMKNHPSVRLDYNDSPEKTFEELLSCYPLEAIEESLFMWLSSYVSGGKLSEGDIIQEHHLYFLIRKAIHQTQRIANDLSISAMDLSKTQTTAQA